MILKLPITTDYRQTFSCTLGDAGTFDFRVYWSTRGAVWMLDIADSTTGDALLNGVRLVCGVNVLRGLGVRDTFGMLVVIDELGAGTDPTSSTLANGFSVYWLSPDESGE